MGTLTEVNDYLRVLFATLGEVHCPTCGERLHAHSVAEVAQETLRLAEGTKFSVLAPVVRAGKTAPKGLLSDLRSKGFVRLRIDDAAADLEDVASLPKGASIDVVIDRLSVRDGIRSRLAEAVELAYQLGEGVAVVRQQDGARQRYSERYTCFDGHASIPKITPQLFSFNTPLGACATCDGLGRTRHFAEELVIADPSLSLRTGAVAAWGKPSLAYYRSMLEKLSAAGVDLDQPFSELPAKQKKIALFGGAGFEGVVPGLDRRANEYARRKLAEGSDEERVLEFLDEELGRFATMETCPECSGSRLNADARSVRIGGASISDVNTMDARAVREWVAKVDVSDALDAAVKPLVRSIEDRLVFLDEVGLGYLSLNRSSATLSAGEAQRVHLATQLGARLSGVLYVLDEPTAGLHPADATRLIETLGGLRRLGNTVVVVEHDEQTIRAADHLVELGPGAGEQGGRLIAEGTLASLSRANASLTGAYLSGRRSMPVPDRRRARGAGSLKIRVADFHNLRDVQVELPLGSLCCVTGVSGSGKSSLIADALLPAVRHELGLTAEVPPGVTLEGDWAISRVSFVDATPIGRSALVAIGLVVSAST